MKDVLLALGGGPHHYPHYPNWAQQCLVTFIIIDHAYANERVRAHDLSVGRLRCRCNIGTKCDRRQQRAAAAVTSPSRTQRLNLYFVCSLLGKMTPLSATTSPVETQLLVFIALRGMRQVPRSEASLTAGSCC